MKKLIELVLIIIIGLLSSLWSGYVLKVLWGWFVVPVFNAPALSFIYAAGLMIVLGFVQHLPKPDPEAKWYSSLDVVILKPLIFLLFGWLIKVLFI